MFPEASAYRTSHLQEQIADIKQEMLHSPPPAHTVVVFLRSSVCVKPLQIYLVFIT